MGNLCRGVWLCDIEFKLQGTPGKGNLCNVSSYHLGVWMGLVASMARRTYCIVETVEAEPLVLHGPDCKILSDPPHTSPSF